MVRTKIIFAVLALAGALAAQQAGLQPGAAGGGATSSGAGPTLQTNGADNGSQSLLNLKAGSNVTLANSGGDVTISSTGGGGTLPVVMPESYGAVGDGKYVFDGSITPLTDFATGSSATPATPAIATAVDGSVVDYIFETNAAWASAPATGTNQISVAFAGGRYGLTVNDQTIATAAPVASASGTTSSSAVWDTAAVVLTPSGGAIGHVGTPESGFFPTGDATINVPTGAATGDTLVAYITHFGANNVTWPSGWTLMFDATDAGGDHLAVGYIKLPASPPASYTWGNTSSGISAAVIAYSNVATVYALSTLTSATANFTSGAVADPICTAATDTGGTGEQCGIVAGYISATEAFVSYIAQSEPTDIWFGYGHDNSAAFGSMLAAAPCSTVGCLVQLGPYGYALSASYVLPPSRSIQFQGAGAGIPDTTNSFKNGNIPPNANTGSRLMWLTQGLTAPAITIGGTIHVTSVAAWDRLSDLALLAGVGDARDGGGSDGVAILNWQDASLNRVIVANFSGRGVYVDGMAASDFRDYISVIQLSQLYTIWNGGPGRQIGSALAVANIETVADNFGISEGNGGPGIKLQGNIQGYTALNDLIQWNNTAASSGDDKSEIEIDNNLPGGCVIAYNYFEDDVPQDGHVVTPGITGCTLANNYIGGPDALALEGHTGINSTEPKAFLQVGGNIVSTLYTLPATSTPEINLSTSNTFQYDCRNGGGLSVAPTLTHLVAGEVFNVIVNQNGAAACTWTWPSAIHGGGTVTSTLGGVSTQQFVVSANGTDAYAVSAIQSTTGGTP